jgi:hypothetical protein
MQKFLAEVFPEAREALDLANEKGAPRDILGINGMVTRLQAQLKINPLPFSMGSSGASKTDDSDAGETDDSDAGETGSDEDYSSDDYNVYLYLCRREGNSTPHIDCLYL